jgi:signal transduction histidine kinase
MIRTVTHFFLDLQKSDERTKKRWLVILAATTMLIVIILWVMYINITIQNLGDRESSAAQSDFSATFQTGSLILVKEIGAKLNELAYRLRSLAETTNSITIQPASVNVVMPNLENITPKKLP